MKRTSKSALYSTIKSTVKKLGISAEDITGIINYIKFMESNTIPEVVSKSNKVTVGETSTGEVILTVLSANTDKPYSIQDIAQEAGFSYAKVQVALRVLKNSRKIKVVDYIPGISGPSKLLYQTWKSPLKALKTVTEKQGYSTLNGFIRDNKKQLIQSVGVVSFPSIVEKAQLESYPLSLSIGIAKGYKNSDLKKLISSTEGKEVKRKYTKKAIKAKRKYTKKVKPETILTETEQKKSLNIFSIFKKKDNNSELIKF